MKIGSLLLTSAAIFVGTVLAACSAEPEPVVSQINVGIGAGVVSGNVYAPNAVTIPAGTALDFTITSDEEHSVTFVGTSPPPAGPPAGWERNLVGQGVGTVAASSFFNTGIVEKGTRVTLEFPEVGSYQFICVIHPGQVFTANVVVEGESYTTQAEAEALVQEASQIIAAAVEPLREEAGKGFTSSQLPDSTTLWEIPSGGFTQTSVGPLELTEFYPQVVNIQAGDTIRWVAKEPHSVTFLPEGQELPPGPPTAIPATKPANDYDPGQMYHSGVFTLGPTGQAPRSFELVFPAPGSYNYLCVLHWNIGHVGTVIVE